MNTSQVSVNLCLKYDIFLSEYGGYSYNSKYMGPYRRVSVALFLKRYILLKVMFVDAFSSMLMKNKSVNFLMKSVETAQQFSHCHHSYSIF